MPFANLPTYEKDAFFALLDEYFTSRPDLLSRVGGAKGSEEPTPATNTAGVASITSAAQRALTTNPAATSHLIAAGINHANGRSRNPSAAGKLATPANIGRVAAAAQAFSPPSASPPPKAASPPVAPRTDSSRLVPQKKFGDVDVSSAGGMWRSLRGSTAAKNAPPPTVYTPPAFSGKKASSGLPPPPVRRVSTSAPASVAPEEDAQPECAEEEEEEGEWAEALYDYTSEEAGDLHLQARERVRVTEKTSSEWWTGEVDGRSGLFPASYVKCV